MPNRTIYMLWRQDEINGVKRANAVQAFEKTEDARNMAKTMTEQAKTVNSQDYYYYNDFIMEVSPSKTYRFFRWLFFSEFIKLSPFGVIGWIIGMSILNAILQKGWELFR